MKLTAAHCKLFNRPFFQFAQLKQHAPETIEPMKANYKAAWQDWRAVIESVAAQLGEHQPPFVPPHIERWCNGWQVRAHFFAYFKYAQFAQDAPILSVLLNRRRLTVSLDWHCYKADRSTIALPSYQNAFAGLDRTRFGDFEIWHGSDSEYDDYPPLFRLPENGLNLRDKQDFLIIGKHLNAAEIQRYEVDEWIVEQILALLPLYEQCFVE
ncbi:HI_0552 family protein [Neisseriaceae bacterium B1]